MGVCVPIGRICGICWEQIVKKTSIHQKERLYFVCHGEEASRDGSRRTLTRLAVSNHLTKYSLILLLLFPVLLIHHLRIDNLFLGVLALL